MLECKRRLKHRVDILHEKVIVLVVSEQADIGDKPYEKEKFTLRRELLDKKTDAVVTEHTADYDIQVRRVKVSVEPKRHSD